MIFFDFFKVFDLHPRCPHPRKRTAAQVVVRLEEALKVAPKGVARSALGTLAGGEGVAAQVVLLLEEALDGVHSCFGLWALGFGLWALGFGLWAFGDFASEIQVFIDFFTNDNSFLSPGSNDNHFRAFLKMS